MINENYLVTHLGNEAFEIIMESGKILSAGSNLCGIIRYTYFEDYTLPEIGWKTTREQLMNDYIPKLNKDILDGKLVDTTID